MSDFTERHSLCTKLMGASSVRVKELAHHMVGDTRQLLMDIADRQAVIERIDLAPGTAARVSRVLVRVGRVPNRVTEEKEL